MNNALCGIGETDIGVFAGKFFGCGVSLVGGIALLFIIYGGYVLMTSSGDPNRLRIGKEYITYSIVGLVLAILAVVILNVIGTDILKIPGLGQ
ncbi:hypothetical protein HYT17_01550 [Candidatus Microgenomates bacterium]|nr:hypothetical protein [Candidatus Microgenomates bacterium]